MLWFKSCPRCAGDLLDREDMYGAYVSCAQCGHVLPSTEEIALRISGQEQGIALRLEAVARR